jgi:hypothetical protein
VRTDHVVADWVVAGHLTFWCLHCQDQVAIQLPVSVAALTAIEPGFRTAHCRCPKPLPATAPAENPPSIAGDCRQLPNYGGTELES